MSPGFARNTAHSSCVLAWLFSGFLAATLQAYGAFNERKAYEPKVIPKDQLLGARRSMSKSKVAGLPDKAKTDSNSRPPCSVTCLVEAWAHTLMHVALPSWTASRLTVLPWSQRQAIG